MSFSQQGPRAICILSANGAVSTVTLRQPSTSGGTVTYEVCNFHVLCVYKHLCSNRLVVHKQLHVFDTLISSCPTHVLNQMTSLYEDTMID